jgi:pimeloyl-ACP methyl ester carboxylesterase
VRLIAVERPGFGWSDHLPGRLITEWPDDVLDLAQALGLARFAVLGMSAGGPYAAVCAARIPERLLGAGIVSGLAPATPELVRDLLPFNRVGLRLAMRAPDVLTGVAPVVRLVTGSGARLLVRNLARAVGEPDRELLQASPLGAVLAASFEEAVRHGAAGMVWEAVLFARPWGEWLSSIPLELRLWHGEEDRVVPVTMGRAMERAIPHCRPIYCPGEGHFSVIVRHGEEILSTLAGGSGDTPPAEVYP